MPTTSSLTIDEVCSRRELRQFIRLPARLHRLHKLWVPTFYRDEWDYFNPKKNKALQYCDIIPVLCRRNGVPVGRVLGIINHRYNEMHDCRTARFSHLESIEDVEVVSGLLTSIESWAREKGMTKLSGPYGLNDIDPHGLLVEGFEHNPCISTWYNFPYLPRMVEECGYTTEENMSVFKIAVPDTIPDFYLKILPRLQQSNTFEVAKITRRSQLKKFIHPILNLVNETFISLYGFTPLDDEEMDDLAKKYISFLDPRFITIVLKGSEVVAFMIGMPNISNGLRKAKGYLFPIGFIHILLDYRRSTQLDLLLGAIKTEYQGKGLDVLMGIHTIESARAAGIKVIDSHLELDSNPKIQAEMERMGGVVYKRYRMYQKGLV